MRYTVEFFALNAHELASQFREDGAGVVEQIQDHLKSAGQRVSRSLKQAVEQIVNGQLPNSCDAIWADAMSAICHSLTEFIRVPELELVSKYEFIEQLGILAPASRTNSPFPLPRFNSSPPQVGFIPCAMLENFRFEAPEPLSQSQKEELESDLADLFQDLGIEPRSAQSLADLSPKVDREEIERTREELQSIFESLHADALDMIIILR